MYPVSAYTHKHTHTNQSHSIVRQNLPWIMVYITFYIFFIHMLFMCLPFQTLSCLAAVACSNGNTSNSMWNDKEFYQFGVCVCFFFVDFRYNSVIYFAFGIRHHIQFTWFYNALASVKTAALRAYYAPNLIASLLLKTKIKSLFLQKKKTKKSIVLLQFHE